MNIAAWLMSLVAPIVIRAIISLGFTAVTLTGITEMTNSLVQTAQSNWSAMPAAVIQLASLSGIPEVLGMITGAYVSLMTIKASIGASRYVFKK
jgi:hypothetical protein